VRAVLPRFADMESKHGSLGRAMLASRRKMQNSAKTPARPLFTSLRNGMQQLVDGVLKELPSSSLLRNASVEALQPQDGAWKISAGYHTAQFDSVILCVPTQNAASMLQSTNRELATELSGITYSSSVTVTLGYDAQVRQSLPPGFGFLVPRSEGRRMLACTFVHNKFPHRAPDDRAIIRCFLGGARDERILNASDNDILEIVIRELREILQLAASPLFARIYRWRGAMAQYGVGHLERLERIERLRRELPGLFLAGNGYRGIGVPDCVRSGVEAANGSLSFLGIGNTREPAPISQSR
jgi:protoporphyrinogen/coproporphyrinogen III oxidase